MKPGTLTTVIAALTFLPMLASAQEQSDRPRTRPSIQGRPQGDQPRIDPFFGRFRNVLDEEQRRSLQKKAEATRQTMGAAMRKMFEKRRAMNVLILGTPVDKKAVRQLSMQIGELEGEIALMRADLIASIQPPLSKAQIEKLTQPPRRPQSRPPQAQPSRAAKTQPPRPEGEKESLEDLIRRGEREENERPRRFDRPSSRPGRDRKQEK